MSLLGIVLPPAKSFASRAGLGEYPPKTIRGENTFQRPGEFKVRRRAQGKQKSPRILRPLRKGVADIQARARIGQAINNRYFDALATADTDKTVQQILSAVLKPTDLCGRRVRALRPWSSPDLEVLRAIGHGEFLTNGFRNRDLVAILYPDLRDDKKDRRRASGRISRLLRILRAHGLIRRVEHSYRYHVTNRGRQVIAAVIATSEASLSKLRRSA
jgi:DNA-binding MarR family transcriptional regulator